MATVTGLTKDRMLAIEAASIVNGAIDLSGHLILTTHGGTTIDAGIVETNRLFQVADTPTMDLSLVGNGSIATPWQLTADAKISLTVTDTPTVDLSLTGAGTNANPWNLSANQIKNEGTAAQRDYRFGTPTTDAQRVALANQKIMWFNSDLGWTESYYAVTGLSGLTARGLVTGTASGWYPVGRGPRLNYAPSTSNTTPGSSNPVTGWSDVQFRNGVGWFSYSSGTFTIAKAGRYKISAVIGLINGAGIADFHHYAGTNQRNVAVALYSGQYNVLQSTFNDIALPAGSTTKINFVTGNALTIFIGTGTGAPYRGEFSIEYLGPNLVTDA